MRTPRLEMMLALIAVSAIACLRKNEGAAPASDPTAASVTWDQVGPEARDACPMLSPNVNVSAADIDGGIALDFTVPDPAYVRDLRVRVEHLAELYDIRRVHGEHLWYHAGSHGPGHATKTGMDAHEMGMGHLPADSEMPASNTEVLAIDGGARLELTAVESEEVETLRAHAREHQRRLQSGQCWLPQGDHHK